LAAHFKPNTKKSDDFSKISPLLLGIKNLQKSLHFRFFYLAKYRQFFIKKRTGKKHLAKLLLLVTKLAQVPTLLASMFKVFT
jgi:hypothetical protein